MTIIPVCSKCDKEVALFCSEHPNESATSIIAPSIEKQYCEPCAKLDASLIDAIEQIDETWVCKRCAHAIRFMKEQERIQINIWIRSGKCPF